MTKRKWKRVALWATWGVLATYTVGVSALAAWLSVPVIAQRHQTPQARFVAACIASHGSVGIEQFVRGGVLVVVPVCRAVGQATFTTPAHRPQHASDAGDDAQGVSI